MSGVYWKDKIENEKDRYIWLDMNTKYHCTNTKPKPRYLGFPLEFFKITCCICDLCYCCNVTMLNKEED